MHNGKRRGCTHTPGDPRWPSWTPSFGLELFIGGWGVQGPGSALVPPHGTQSLQLPLFSLDAVAGDHLVPLSHPSKYFPCLIKNGKSDSPHGHRLDVRGWLQLSFPCLLSVSEWVSECPQGSLPPHLEVWAYFEHTKPLLTAPGADLKECSKQTIFQPWSLVFPYPQSCPSTSWRNSRHKCWPGSHLAERGTKGQRFTPAESQTSLAFISLFFAVP